MDPTGRRESVRRSLFGPVDHDQLRRDLALQLREIAERDSRRWNFNFGAETPLSGRFQWEEIPADCAAAVYQERAEPREDDRLSGREDSSGTDQENRSGVSNARHSPADATPVRRRKRTLSKPAAKAGTLSRITDFFAKRRRTTEAKSILSASHTSCSEAASCRRIR
ncbi:cyclin-dependent kinase inhibitor 1 [Pungitius pungitius]|uniref:cyclin-dependent kinase inhibitor 1 n=1 Tax=Pungitius pungitius TaxID=134920 RepID=UPI001888EA98|nr:cyclin-dependent kinase inhibitor 1 [Pungitius pungitius]